MKEELLILDEDRRYAMRRVAELEREIQELGPEFYEVFNQSSETWHDNAPFDALRDRQSVLDAELQSIRQVLRSSLPSLPRQKAGVIGIGSKVLLEGKTGLRSYLIAGDWTPHAGAKREDGALVVSRKTPVAKALLGKKKNSAVVVAGAEFTVMEISS